MALPTDDLFSEQWYLHNTVVGQFDLDVVKAWADYTGAGVHVVVMDSGIDYTHSDIAPNYDTADDHDYGQGDNDPLPANSSDDESHGTAVAGIIGAAANGTGVVGVAYGATLIGYRLDTVDLESDKQAWVDKYVAAMNDVADHNVDIVNMSFGYYEIFGTYFSEAQRQAQLGALDNAVDNGRSGLGAILVKSAMNDRVIARNVNGTEVGNDTKQIIVAGVDQDGFVSSYSSFGSPVLISAFGSSGDVVTTDRTGTAGYQSGDYMENFAGTSAAAPMISGVVALMLQANPDLGWRDVQTILGLTARHVGSEVGAKHISGNETFHWFFNAADNWNGGGMHYSEDYGYGLVDALAAVRLAESWDGAPATSANEKAKTIDLLSGSRTIPDGDANGKAFARKIDSGLTIERVTVTADFHLGHSSDLDIYLAGPNGKERLLTADSLESHDPNAVYQGVFTFHSQAFRGVNSGGTWSVRFVDNQTGTTMKVSDLSITLFGSKETIDNTYYYTNEFSDYVGKSGHSDTLRDSNGGVDTLNAAAVSSATTIDLSAGVGTVDGVAMKISGIENAYGGDESDHIRGNSANNTLCGGRGGDVLSGGSGADTFLYDTAKDSVDGRNHDLIRDYGNGDLIDLSPIDPGKRTGDQAFRFIGTDAFSGKAGQLDFELVDRHGVGHDSTLVFVDLNGDKVADFEIELTGLHHLVRGDFVL